jgi:transcriptional regulator with XRE-family HTH domain
MLILRRDDKVQILGERLRILREEAGFSQNKLAKLIGIQQSSLNRYESGFSNPTPETLLWFADYFDVSMDYIYGRTDKPQGKTYKYKPRLDPDMAKFVEMCFEPGTRANKELKASILKMVSEEKK